MLSTALYFIAGFMAFGAFSSIQMIGKPRKPMEPSVAAETVAINAVFITTLIIAARRL